MIFRAEYKKTPEGFHSVRIHRSYENNRRYAKGLSEPEKIDLPGYTSDSPQVFAFFPEEVNDLHGPSHRMESGVVLTAEPELFPEERVVRCFWEEWNFIL